MPLDDAMDWEVMGPKYRARVIELDAEIKARHENTIKRCAKVAMDYARRAWSVNPPAQEAAMAAEHIAAAFEALKDKP